MSAAMSERRSVGFRRSLYPSEIRVLTCLADGETRDNVALELGVSRTSVNHALAGAFAALGVPSLVGAYRALGWLAVPA
jgi:DNA-binding NarL/FixJ family response regulator